MRRLDERLRRNIWALISLLLVGAWFALLAPTSIGGDAGYILVSGKSMEPTMHTGDFVITRKQSTYSVGDIVAYRVPKGDPAAGRQVIHRIVGGSAERGYDLVGDNNDKVDPWHPRAEDIVGKRFVLVPRFGRVVAALRSPVGLAAIAGLLTAWAVLGTDRKKKQPAEPSPPSKPENGTAAPEIGSKRGLPLVVLAVLALGALTTVVGSGQRRKFSK